MNASTVVKRHSFGTVTTSSEMNSGDQTPVGKCDSSVFCLVC